MIPYLLSIILNVILILIFWWLSIVYYKAPFNFGEAGGMIAALLSIYLLNGLLYYLFIRKRKNIKLTIFHFSSPLVLALLFTGAFILLWGFAMN